MRVLTLIDVLRIQPFIFASNRLRDVVTGSEMVVFATERAFLENQLAEWLGADRGEVVYAAGGNALLDFPSLCAARRFAARYSRWLLEEFPGLEVEMVHLEYGDGDWLTIFERAQRKMARAKLSRRPHSPVLGLGVTAECAETRRPATHRFLREGGQERPIAPEVAKRRSSQPAAHTWENRLGIERWGDYRLLLPREVDKLGRSHGETSFVGVVHVDGNGVGARIRAALEPLRAGGDDRAKAALRELSEEIDGVVLSAWKKVNDRVIGSLRSAVLDGVESVTIHSPARDIGFPLEGPGDRRVHKKLFLPLRPVLQGGDDLTFLCDGRLALDLARTALEAFRDAPVSRLGSTLGACAGIALVKSHAPFFRAYDLAEALCARAKGWLHQQLGTSTGYAMDWQLAGTSLIEALEERRQREFHRGGNVLSMRPYLLGDRSSPFTFTWLDEVLLGPGLEDGARGGFFNDFWQHRRNKIKALEALLGEGGEAVAASLKTWKITAGVDALPGELARSGGFHGETTPLLDAIEILDLHFPLRGSA